MVHPPLLLVILLGTTPALAGGKVKAHVDCMSGDPVKSGKPAKLTAELWCTIAVDSLAGYKPGDLTGNLTIVTAKTTTLKKEPEARFGPLADTQDGVEFRLDKPFAIDTDYRACEPFTINASLNDPNQDAYHMAVWSSKFTVSAACPKPKKVAGTLACHYTAQDGTLIKWPGNGTKLKARLEAPLSCSITAAKTEKDVKYEVSLGVTGADPKKGGFEHDEAGGAFFENQIDESVYHACSNFTVAGEVRANGTSLWTGKLAIKQDCPD